MNDIFEIRVGSEVKFEDLVDVEDYSLLVSLFSQLFIIFRDSGPRSGPGKSTFCYIPGYIIFI